MSFIAKNPLILPEVEDKPTSPLRGGRGIFPKADGWHDIDSNGETRKIATSEDVDEKVAKKADRENTVGGFTAGKDITVTDEDGEEILEQSGNAFVNSDDENGKEVWTEDSGVYVGKNIKAAKNSIIIGKNILSSNENDILIGDGAENIGSSGITIGSGAKNYGGTIVGNGAYSGGGFAGGNYANNTGRGASLGERAISRHGVAGGLETVTGDGVALGKQAKTQRDNNGNIEYIDAIQLGTGTNSEEKTLQVYDYKLMNADGTIPEDRIPKLTEHDAEIKALKASGGGMSDSSNLVNKSLYYYGDSNITPTDEKYFNITEDGAISRNLDVWDDYTVQDVVIPYEVDGIKVTKIAEKGFGKTDDASPLVLTTVIMPNSITSIGFSAFSYCPIENIVIPDGVTLIGSDAFFCCGNLSNVTIPNSVKTIKLAAFQDTFLNNVIFKGSKSQWDAIDIVPDGNEVLLNANIIFEGNLATEEYVDEKCNDNSVEIVDNLKSDATDKALSANQGLILKMFAEGLDNLKLSCPTVLTTEIDTINNDIIEFFRVIEAENDNEYYMMHYIKNAVPSQIFFKGNSISYRTGVFNEDRSTITWNEEISFVDETTLDRKADKATTLAGYGIEDALTVVEEFETNIDNCKNKDVVYKIKQKVEPPYQLREPITKGYLFVTDDDMPGGFEPYNYTQIFITHGGIKKRNGTQADMASPFVWEEWKDIDANGGSVDLSEYEKLHGKIGVINAYNSVPILIDTTNKTITIKGATSTFLVSTAGQNINITTNTTISTDPQNEDPQKKGYQNGAVVYNLTSGKFELRPNNAAGGLKTDDILILTYNQYGKFVNCPSMHSIDNNLYGIDIQPEYEMLSPNYEFINLPNVGFWSDFCFVNNKLLIFVASGDEDHVKQNGKIVIINTETWTIEKTLYHDFGHCNTVDYNAETDTLLIGNLPGNTQYQGALYIFYDVSSWVDFGNNHVLLFDDLSPTIVDLQSLGTIYKGELLDKNIDNVVACWGGTNNGQNNVVYVNTQYNRDWFKLLLGKGSNNLGNGTFTEAEETKFNGSFAALWHDKFSIIYEIGQEVTQGIIYDNGKICTSNGHNDIQFFDWNITNKGLTRQEYHESIYNPDRSNKYCVSEGYTEKDGYRYVGCIFTTDETRNKATGEYGILKIKKSDGASNKPIIQVEDVDTQIAYNFSENNNTDIRITTELTSISFYLNTSNVDSDFVSSLSFTMLNPSLEISFPTGGVINWVGTDCSLSEGQSVFIPISGKHYDIVFYYNGTSMVGMVNGFVPAEVVS